ncbi:amino acid ABC transporter ATP-binding protein [Humitalea sp. 24SJ18S-53]|uniref:amino acid ABC transporter ATP-binding protein n=1 Tax=Humitalea sp. 24SJ18S-53 TaxID=3422307 RepID=UPI003D67B6E7
MMQPDAERPIVLAARGITKRFGATDVLAGVDLDIHAGEVVALIGASGSGKSTLLRCLNLLVRADAGEILLDGVPVGVRQGPGGPRPAPESEVLRYRASVGMVFQSFNLFPHMTALENIIEAPMAVRGLSRDAAVALARDLLAKVRLENREQHYPAQLSGGQQQRVAIARALAMEPRVMLFDEVTSALDPELVEEVLRTVRALAQEGMTMVIVSHEMGFVRSVADRVVFMAGGRIVESGPPAVILERPTQPETARFIRSFREREGAWTG